MTLYVYSVYAHILKEINIGFTQVEQEYILFSTKLCCRKKNGKLHRRMPILSDTNYYSMKKSVKFLSLHF